MFIDLPIVACLFCNVLYIYLFAAKQSVNRLLRKYGDNYIFLLPVS